MYGGPAAQAGHSLAVYFDQPRLASPFLMSKLTPKMVKTGVHLQPLRQVWIGYVRFANRLIGQSLSTIFWSIFRFLWRSLNIIKPMTSSLLAVGHMSISMCDPLGVTRTCRSRESRLLQTMLHS